MPFFDDPGFWKRAQITANDLALAGVAEFDDLDQLTIFADNLVPHVLRVDGVLLRRAARGPHRRAASCSSRAARRREIRACAVHACELIAAELGVPPRTLDTWLWNRGQEPRYKALRATARARSSTRACRQTAGRTCRRCGPRRRTRSSSVATTSPPILTFTIDAVVPEVVELGACVFATPSAFVMVAVLRLADDVVPVLRRQVRPAW